MSSRTRKRRCGLAQRLLISLLAVLLLAALPLAMVACGDDGEEPGPEPDGNGEVRIGWIAWDECIATTYLWQRILEDEGYDVTLTQLDVAPVYAGLAAGDLEFFTDAWLPITHEDYWDEYGDRLEDIQIWYDKGTLELTVPAYVEDVNTIADLQGRADEFGGRIVGIEPGAGLTRLTREAIIPGYELDGYELLEGSTPAMLAELKRAIDREEPIVVTLWRPHWVYAAHDLKDLEDTEGLFGDGDKIHVIARLGFSADFPEIAEWLSNFRMDDDALATLSQLVIDEYGSGREEEAVEEWLSDPDNRALVDSWLGK
jgi:glycine betaine/proline transport system substrate-binding protein